MRRKIYNVNGGVIEVYSFEPFNYKMNTFRMRELKKIPMERQVLVKEPTRSWFTPKKGVVYKCDNYILREVQCPELDPSDPIKRTRTSYIYGIYKNDPVEVHDDLYLLSPRGGYTDYRVQLTEDSYLGYLLENEQFYSSFLEDKSLEGLKDLFKVSSNPITRIQISELEKMYEGDLVPGSFDDAMTSLEKTSKVYQKIR